MSTKIHTGFKFKTNDFNEIHSQVNAFREELKVVVVDKVKQHFAEDCTARFDRRTLDPMSDCTISVYGETYNEFTSKQNEIRISGVKDPSVDYEFNITVFPHNGEFYGMFYTVQPDFAKMWLTHPLVEDFMYWDNSDAPENLTKEDWSHREKIWDEIFETSSVPSSVGFTYEMLQNHYLDIPDAHDLVDFVPSLKDRTYDCGTSEVFKTFGNKRKINDTNVVKVFMAYKEHLATIEGQKELDTEIYNIQPKLKLVLSGGDFNHHS